jgi:hypothetical protein
MKTHFYIIINNYGIFKTSMNESRIELRKKDSIITSYLLEEALKLTRNRKSPGEDNIN